MERWKRRELKLRRTAILQARVIFVIHIIRSKAEQRSMRNWLPCQLGTRRCTILPITESSRSCQVIQDMDITHLHSFKFIHPLAMDVVRVGRVIIVTSWDNHDCRHLYLTTTPLSPHKHTHKLVCISRSG
ncbi:hypothetical protein PAXRUDRAFT_766220 [Paxillus rubicundulus Ve08.2h10]|uniref:Uncharacterized protein n=1 Tax=Paxillus rubicundulus Ve08.2h10 TaxID=930991 RepID=A0A0D0CBU8_9AGAM|nr:hypothetical protein PAXRUDRAFT_766220 [Paxillus rubicundulus Ve08.2h10]